MNRKIKAILSAAILFSVSIFYYTADAEQLDDINTAVVLGTPDAYVDIGMSEFMINFGTLNISMQEMANSRYEANCEYVIFESQYDNSNDYIGFNEGASNSNIFTKVTCSGESYPASGGLNNSKWIYFKDSNAVGYVQPKITGTLENGGGGVTMPTGVIEVGSFSTDFIYYVSADAGITWTRYTKKIYVALGNDAKLYVSDSPKLSSSIYYTEKGEAVNMVPSFFGNSFVESSAFPSMGTDKVTLDFGYAIPWDTIQANSNKDFYALIDLPIHAACGHNWTWNISIVSEYVSNP